MEVDACKVDEVRQGSKGCSGVDSKWCDSALSRSVLAVKWSVDSC